VHLLHEEPNHDLAVFLIAWLPNRGTKPHNHKTWAVVIGLEGEEQEVNWDRLDDGGKPGHAELKLGGKHVMTAGDVARCYPEHIHSVWNVGKDISMSLHTYGRHINYTGRSEFDPARKLEQPFVVKVAGEEPARA
jgi:predicted metal-dependent enzyme (double-stranded beta helix superfamily)